MGGPLTPRLLAVIALWLTLLLWAAWVVFLIIKMSAGVAWPFWALVAVLVSWIPLYAVGLLRRVSRRGVDGVGAYGALMTVFAVPATFIGARWSCLVCC